MATQAYTTEQIIDWFEKGLKLSDLTKIAGEGGVEAAFREKLGNVNGKVVRRVAPIVSAPAPVTPPARQPILNRIVFRGDVLRLLQTGPSKVTDLATILGQPAPKVRQLLNKAERDHGIVREKNFFWYLTEKGKAYTDKLQGGQFLSKQAMAEFLKEWKATHAKVS